MKQLHFLFVVLGFVTFLSCDKSSTLPTGPIGDYITSKGYTDVQMLVDTASQDTMWYVITEKGTGEKVQDGDYVSVHYTGKLMANDTTFDSSVGKDPFQLPVGAGRVIKGWDLGLQQLNKGDKAVLLIPSSLGYGEREIAVIPANSDLAFEVEMLDILDADKYTKEVNESISNRIAEYVNKSFADQIAKEKPTLEAYAKGKGYEYITTKTGLMVVIDEKGTGKTPVGGESIIDVHYTGTTLDGKKFDSSVDRGQPISFPIAAGRVIVGWDEGLLHFNKGGKGKLIIPSSLAYGEKGSGENIPANAPLVFDVELVDVK